MPVGVSTSQYVGILGAAFGSAALGSLFVHLMMRPDRNPPVMGPFIDAQRDLIRRVQKRKDELSETSEGVQIESSKTGDVKLNTSYGKFGLDELNPETGMPIPISAPSGRPKQHLPKFWMYMPIPLEAVQDLTGGSPVVEISPSTPQT